MYAGFFGRSVASAGDFNGDGVEDFVIGSPIQSSLGIKSGRVYVFSGIDADTLAILQGLPGYQLGSFLDGGFDVNNDGYSDIVVSGADSVFVFLGPDARLSFGSKYGGAPRFAGDMDGDGAVDLLIANIGDATRGRAAGRVIMLSGRSGNVISVLWGEAAGDQFGSAIDRVGDIDGDGINEFIVGAPTNQAGGYDAGRAYLFTGGANYYLCGDLNLSATVDSTDAQILVDFYFNQGPEPVPLAAADVNCDGQINLLDVLYLYNLLTGWIPELCCPNTSQLPDRQIQYEDRVSSD